MDPAAFKELLFAYGRIVRFFLMTLPGVLILGLVLAVFFLIRVWHVARTRALACQAAGQNLKTGERILLVFKELYSLIIGLAGAIPALLAVFVIAGTLYAVSDSLERFDRLRLNAERISELSAVVRNLEKRYRVADVFVRAHEQGIMDLELAFYVPGEKERVVSRQQLRLRGNSVYFDALVFNFDYAEIAAGRRVNLAIPYRIFTDQLAQADGIELHLRDTNGVPYIYSREEPEIYGLAPGVYHQRLRELMSLIEDEKAARLGGIVRSVYGSAVHRRVASGDRFTVWIEQTGGMVIKNQTDF